MEEEPLDTLFGPSRGLLGPVKGTPGDLDGARRTTDKTPYPLSRADIEQIATACWLAYSEQGAVYIDTVSKHLEGWKNPTKEPLANLIELDATKKALSERGIPDNSRIDLITPKQVMALQIIFAPTAASFETRLKRAGITLIEWQTWLRNRRFAELYSRMGETKLEHGVPAALSAMTDKATDGDMGAIKLLLEMTGRHNPNGGAQVNLMGVMSKVVDIIQEELLGDPEKMMSIAKRLKSLADSEQERSVQVEQMRKMLL